MHHLPHVPSAFSTHDIGGTICIGHMDWKLFFKTFFTSPSQQPQAADASFSYQDSCLTVGHHSL